MTIGLRIGPVNREAEQAVLGAVLLADTVLEPLVVETGLRPEHFYYEQHAAIYRSMVELHDQQRPVDVLTLTQAMRSAGRLDAVGGPAMIDALAGAAPAAGNAREYAGIVLKQASWRARSLAASAMLDAVQQEDEDAFGVAEALIAQSDRPEATTLTADDLAHDVFEYLSGDSTSDTIPLPWPELNDLLAGGLRRGDVTLVAGWTSAGKSIVVDQALEHAAGAGFSTHAYINEMSPRDRTLRTIASLSGVAFRALMARRLDERQHRAVLAAMQRFTRLGMGMTDVSGWSALDIARHIRRRRWDVCCVDLVNLIPHKGTDEIDAISATLNAAARQSACHVLVVCQLNQARNVGERLPRPVRRDIRESGQLANDAANVLMVHRDQHEVGSGPFTRWETGQDGALYFEKARNGRLGQCEVTLNPSRMRFQLASEFAVPGART